MRTLIIGGLLLLAGCDKPDVKACEDFILDGLRSPSSYRRVAISVSETPIAFEAVRKISAAPELYTPSTDFRMNTAEPLIIRVVRVEFDAENAFGAALRSKTTCAFRHTKGSALNSMVSLARARERDRLRAAADPAIPDLPELPYPCCI